MRFAADKRPLTTEGFPASSTNQATWASFDHASKSRAGVGYGLVLTGDGLGCYDLDHCVTDGLVNDAAKEYLAGIDSFYVEISPSGTGVHAWVHASAQKGWRRKIDGLNVEFYTRERYITVTGKRI